MRESLKSRALSGGSFVEIKTGSDHGSSIKCTKPGFLHALIVTALVLYLSNTLLKHVFDRK